MRKIRIPLFLATLLILAYFCTSCIFLARIPNTEVQIKGPETGNNIEMTEESLDITDPTLPDVPEGYSLYNDGYVVFAYPASWAKQDGSVVILQGDGGNNITSAYETKTDYYVNLTAEGFIADMKPLYESMGLVTSNEAVTQTVNSKGVAITNITYDATMSGVPFTQCVYIVNSGDRTYSITVSIFEEDEALLSNVFESLTVLK